MQKWKIKTLIVLIAKIEAIFFIALIVLPKNEGVATFMQVTFVMRWAIWIPVLLFFIIRGIARKSKEIKVPDNYYNKEINEKYTPAMASLIIDKEIEEKETFMATILDLHARNYLKINTVEQDKNNKGIIKSDIENLYLHELYALECWNNKRDLDFRQFKDCIIKDCIKAKLITIGKSAIAKMLVMILLIQVFLFYFFPFFSSVIQVSEKFVLWYTIVFLLSIIGLFFTSGIKRTEKGIDFAIEIQGLKNYIRDFSLLNEKDIDNIIVNGRYIPFAVALGEAEKIEDKYILNEIKNSMRI